MVDSPHGKGVTFTIRSAPVGYAAEYLTRGRFSAIPMGLPLLVSICCILYHFPLYQFYTFYMFYTAIIFSFRVFRGSNLCVLCVLCG